MIREHCTSTAIRPRPTLALPESGPFDFGAPYGTTGVRITNASDGPILPCGYSYWSNVNAHAGQDHLLVFLGTDRNRGGQGPSLWRVDKGTLAVMPLGPLFRPEHPLSWSTGEGWYFSAVDPFILYVSDAEHLYRYHVLRRRLDAVVDLTPFRHLGRFALWQWHSSADGTVHSATVKAIDQDYKPIGTVVYREQCAPWDTWRWYPAVGALDESQVDASGQWLVIKENLDGQDGEDNRIIRLATGEERRLMDRDGAAGHSDVGHGYMVAADNWFPRLPAAWRLWMLDGTEPQGRLVHYSHAWETQVQHVSHSNARPGSPDGQWVIGSGATRAHGPRANELVAFRLDGSLEVCVLAPTMTTRDGYDDLPKANVDAGGEYVLWTANPDGRRDAFLVKVPEWR